MYDYHFLYRVNVRGKVSEWEGIDLISGRRFHQIFWFPQRRTEKAVFDIANGMALVIDRGFSVITRTPDYRLLDGYVAAGIRATDPAGEVDGYQVALARTAGYDSGEKPEMVMVAPYTPLTH